MIRQNKNGLYHVDCSHCKQTTGLFADSEEEAIKESENLGYAVVGKFHFCPSCFSDMLERWKNNNQVTVGNCVQESV